MPSDPNLYTRINNIAPTPHANFGRGQLFPITANPFTILGHMPPTPHSTFHPFLPNSGTHTHTHKTTTEDDHAFQVQTAATPGPGAATLGLGQAAWGLFRVKIEKHCMVNCTLPKHFLCLKITAW